MAALSQVLLTWSNALTGLRLVAAPFFFCALMGGAWGLAGTLFWGAVVTDVVDGRLARARGETSAFGGLLDHATDATFVTAGLSALAMHGFVPWALPVFVVAAFLQYLLDSKALEGRVLRASALGRWNGIFYFVPPGMLVTREMLGLDWPEDSLVFAIGTLLVVSSIVSMFDRLLALRRR